MNWHYATGDERHGPVDEATIATLIASGEITRSTLVWRPGIGTWTEASETELARLFTSTSEPTVEPSPYAPPRAVVEPEVHRGGTAYIPRRDAAFVILLTVFTCGIFGWYLLYKWADEVNEVSGTAKYNPLVVLLATIFTCGIAGVVFHILYAFDLEKLAVPAGLEQRQANLGGIVSALLIGGYLLGFIGVPAGLVTAPIAYWLVQAELNKFAA